MSDSYSCLSKNFVLSECKGTKKIANMGIKKFRKFRIKKEDNPSSKSLFKPQTHINKSFIFQRKKEQIVRIMGSQDFVFIYELCKHKKKIRT